MIRKIFNGPVAFLLMLLLLFFSLQLISSASMDSEQFRRLYYVLLAMNLVILLLLLLLIYRQGWRLFQQLKKQVAGARLTLRMMLIFVSLSVLPALVVYSFSIQFIHRSIDSWFDVSVEHALQDAMELSRSAVDEKKKSLLRQIRQLSREILNNSDALSLVALTEIREKSAVDEVTLMTSKGKVLGSSSIHGGGIVPDIPSAELLLPLRQGRDHVVLDLNDTESNTIRVLVRITFEDEEGFLILQAMAPLIERNRKMAASVQQAYSEYKGLVYLRKPLKLSFTLTLSLVLWLAILSAVWAAFFSARRIASPIRDLAEGTKAVAEGEYHKPIPLLDNDDLGQLVQSFNKMMRRLSQTRDELEKTHIQAKNQRDDLGVLLSNLSSGVISLNSQLQLRLSNPEASLILGLDLDEFDQQPLENLLEVKPELEVLIRWIQVSILNKVKHWSEEVSIPEKAGRKVLLCRGNALADGGYVVVIENVTTLVQAQRDAAWGEVARRLAHEIKNPLTPIQLSAERLRHKYLKTMPAEDAQVLDRLTATIIHQVDSMKEMVKAFSEYARMPELKLQAIEIEQLLAEVLDLYRGTQKLTIQQDFSIAGTVIEADQGRVRQVFHNLIKNSLEACAGQDKIILQLITHLLEVNNQRWCELEICDNGPGFPVELLENIFDPYVTNKPKGTGLGMAIVKKIVEEHGGSIQASNRNEGGARIMIRLPVV